MMDGDLQHPPQLIPTLLDRWRDGYDIVSTLRLETEDIPAVEAVLLGLFYRVFNSLSTMRIEAGNADFRLMSRAAVDALNALPERHRFLRGLIPWLGFPRTQVEFKAPARWAGRSKYTFLKNIRFALEGLTAFNFYPLRIVAAAGGLIACVRAWSRRACLVAYLRAGEPGAAWVAMALVRPHSWAAASCSRWVSWANTSGGSSSRSREGPPTSSATRKDSAVSEPQSRAIPAPHLMRAGSRAGQTPASRKPAERQIP